MGLPVMILGESGSGKSASLRNFKDGEIGIFNVASKRLPFPNSIHSIKDLNGIKERYDIIQNGLKENKIQRYVIDDSQYLLAFEMFEKANEKGYEKFTTFAVHFKRLIDYAINATSDDTIVYFLHHPQIDERGIMRAKTVGRMLDEKLVVEGLFTIVLRAFVDNGRYLFKTQTDGFDTVKSPMGMFEPTIDNDLKNVDTAIREYYNMSGVSPKGEENETD